MNRFTLCFAILLSLVLSACSSSKVASSNEWTKITNGNLWLTASGDTVQAHAPGFLKIGDTWYMVGEDRGREWRPDVNLYKSKDLQNWTFVKKIIENGVTSP
ncbi:MAG: hypothetical protein J6P96_04635, partial [Bacteroidaceae bacterium]|nr:hypothetical protein [Bacteroidaceae bacterium]